LALSEVKNICISLTTVSCLTMASFPVQAQGNQREAIQQAGQANRNIQYTGKPVSLVYGSDVSSTSLQITIEAIEDSGCKVSTRLLGNSNKMIVRTDGKGWSTDDAISAASWAIRHCVKVPKEETFSGHSVVFQYGPGISEELMQSLVRVIIKNGCHAEARNDGIPRRVRAVVNGKSYSFNSPNSAAGWALEHCKTD